MKTLKKTLCLVLAMVMVFGLCAISASANLGYADTDDITYKEAVDVMSGIGILSGDARGFRPTDDITRAEAAKILAYIIVGNAAQADAVKASSAPFVDVPASHWAAGYISYCAAAGVIMGKADGYHPSDKVTGLEFAVMLLRALGYGKQGEFVGSDWSINASREALRLGIFDGNYAGANTNPATREECALYAFNTITKINKVSYSDLLGSYVTSSAFGGTGASVDANKNDKFADDFKLKNTKSTEESDDFGRIDGYYWYVNKSSNRVTNYYVDGAKLKEVYTTEVTGADIYNLLGADAIKDAELIVCDNQDSTTVIAKDNSAAADAWNTANFAKGKTTALTGTGNGTETYVYAWTDDDGNHIKVVIIDTYMVKVNTVTKATATKDAATTVTLLTPGSGVTNPTISGSFETDEFAKGDYVLVTVCKSDNKIRSMEPVTVVEDEITRYNQNGTKKSIVVGGTTYAPAKNAVKDADMTDGKAISRALVTGDDYKVYVDKGYVIAVDAVTTDSSYVYVAAADVKLDDSGKLGTGWVVKADIYYADGTNEIVTVDTTNDATINNVTVTNQFKNGGDAVSSSTYKDALAGKVDSLYQLTWKSDKAILTGTATSTASGSEPTVNKGIATLTAGAVSDNKTVFFYKTGTYAGDDLKITTYTGINNVPVAKTGEAKLLKYVDDSGVKAALVASNFSGEGDTVYFYVGAGTDPDSGTYDKVGTTDIIYYVYAAGADETTELQLTYKGATEINAAISAAQNPGFYKVGSGNNLATVTIKNGSLTYTAGKTSFAVSTGNDTLTVDGTTQYALYNCHIVDVSGASEPITDAAGLTNAAKIFFAYDDSTMAITDLYVTEHNS